MPIFEGFALPHSVQRVDIAGRDVTRRLQFLLKKQGFNFHTSAEVEIVRRMKEKACYVTPNPSREESLLVERREEEDFYTLPDGRLLM